MTTPPRKLGPADLALNLVIIAGLLWLVVKPTVSREVLKEAIPAPLEFSGESVTHEFARGVSLTTRKRVDESLEEWAARHARSLEACAKD